MTIYLGNLWRGKENYLEFDSTHWTQYFNEHKDSQDELNRYLPKWVRSNRKNWY